MIFIPMNMSAQVISNTNRVNSVNKKTPCTKYCGINVLWEFVEVFEISKRSIYLNSLLCTVTYTFREIRTSHALFMRTIPRPNLREKSVVHNIIIKYKYIKLCLRDVFAIMRPANTVACLITEVSFRFVQLAYDVMHICKHSSCASFPGPIYVMYVYIYYYIRMHKRWHSFYSLSRGRHSGTTVRVLAYSRYVLAPGHHPAPPPAARIIRCFPISITFCTVAKHSHHTGLVLCSF